MATVLLLSGLVSQCSPPIKQLKGDRAFIKYHPRPQGSDQLRLAVKDLIDVKGEVTTAGSEHFAKKGVPAKEDAACLAPARARGVWIVGKTNLTEFALGGSGLNDYFGTPKNHLTHAWRLMPGGSSSGSAVAVANGKADVAFGTDTAGSVRTPAACCGVYGLKTTFGLVPLKGVFPLSPKHLDTVGPLAKDIPRLVKGMDLLQPGSEEKYQDAAAANPTGRHIKVGRLYLSGTDSEIDKAVDLALKKAGFQVVRLDASFEEAWKLANENGNRIAMADGYANDKEYLREKGVTTTTKATLLLGEIERNSERYHDAVAKRKVWQARLRQIFQQVDFIAVPTLKKYPYRIPIIGRFALFEARVLEMQNTVAVNYAGNPAIAIPIPVESRKVPVTSLQLIGPRLSEAQLLNAGRIVASKSG